jgi:hypothetical protein
VSLDTIRVFPLFLALYVFVLLDIGFLHVINGINYREFLWCPN